MTLNAPEVTAKIVAEATVKDTYGRAQTALAMASMEIHNLTHLLSVRAIALRAEADEIDRFLVEASKNTDSWYQNIVAERDLAEKSK